MKEYVGDGLYIEFDGFGFTVTSENGINVLDTIYLEPEILESLVRIAQQMSESKGDG